MKFEKVSFDEFFNAQKKAFAANCSLDAILEVAKKAGLDEKKFTQKALNASNERIINSPGFKREVKNLYDKIKLPRRGTMYSAGYDFYFSCTSTPIPPNS